MALNVVVSNAVQGGFLVLFCTLIYYQCIKMRYMPTQSNVFTLCKILTLQRLSFLMLVLCVIKVLGYYALIYDPWISKLQCNPNLRFLFWLIKILIQIFVALRSRFSCASTDCKWYRFGLFLIVVGIVMYLSTIIRLAITGATCSGTGDPHPVWANGLLIQDVIASLYALCVYIIPLKKTIKALDAISVISGHGGASTVKLNLFANKVMIYSSIIMMLNVVLCFLAPFLRRVVGEESFASNGFRDKNIVQLVQNAVLLVNCYCVVVQFDIDIETVQSRWVKWTLILCECNNYAAKACACCPCCLSVSSTAKPLEKPHEKEAKEQSSERTQSSGGTVDSVPSVQGGRVEMQCIGVPI